MEDLEGRPAGKSPSSGSVKEIKVKVKVKMDRAPKRKASGRKTSRR
jgi:hypothetical protein